MTSLSLSGNIEAVILGDLFLAFVTYFKYSVNSCVQGKLCSAAVKFATFAQLGVWGLCTGGMEEWWQGGNVLGMYGVQLRILIHRAVLKVCRTE